MAAVENLTVFNSWPLHALFIRIKACSGHVLLAKQQQIGVWKKLEKSSDIRGFWTKEREVTLQTPQSSLGGDSQPKRPKYLNKNWDRNKKKFPQKIFTKKKPDWLLWNEKLWRSWRFVGDIGYF
jgi:hypothetical protein